MSEDDRKCLTTASVSCEYSKFFTTIPHIGDLNNENSQVKYYDNYSTYKFIKYCHENLPGTMRFCFDVPYTDHKQLIALSGGKYLQRIKDTQTKIFFPDNERCLSMNIPKSNQVWIVGNPTNVQRVYRNLRDCSQYLISFKKSQIRDKDAVDRMIEHIVEKKLKVAVRERMDDTYHITSDRKHYVDLMDCCTRFLSGETKDVEYVLAVSVQCIISSQNKETSESIMKWISMATHTKIYSPSSSFHMSCPSSFFIKGDDISDILRAETFLVGCGTIIMSFDVPGATFISQKHFEKWRSCHLLDIWIETFDSTSEKPSKSVVFIRTVEFNINEAYKAAFYIINQKVSLVENIYVPIARSLFSLVKEEIFEDRNRTFLTLGHGKEKTLDESIGKNVDEEYHENLEHVQVSPFSVSNSPESPKPGNITTPKSKDNKKKKSPKKSSSNENNETEENFTKMKKVVAEGDVKIVEKARNHQKDVVKAVTKSKDKTKDNDNKMIRLNPLEDINVEQGASRTCLLQEEVLPPIQPIIGKCHSGCCWEYLQKPITDDDMRRMMSECSMTVTRDRQYLIPTTMQVSYVNGSYNDENYETETNENINCCPPKSQYYPGTPYIMDKYPRVLNSGNLGRIKTWVMMSLEELNDSILTYIRPFILSNEVYCFIGYCIPDEIYKLEYRCQPPSRRVINRVHRTKYPRYNYFPTKCFNPSEVVFYDFESNTEVEMLLNSPSPSSSPSKLILPNNTYPWIAPMSATKKTTPVWIKNQITQKFWYFKHCNLIPITGGDGLHMYMHVNLSKNFSITSEICDFRSKNIFTEYLEQTKSMLQRYN
uniref:KH domain-containing protein n=1 Tax=Strongyloides venezuelensis TaxID=75913 RepID=A0A0K0EY79_STRVS